MSDNTYNGWTNYETWVVKLWMDNEQSSQEYWAEEAATYAGRTDPSDDLETRKDEVVYELAKILQSTHEESKPETTGVFADLLSSAIDSVNWREIAHSMVDELEDDAFPVAEVEA